MRNTLKALALGASILSIAPVAQAQNLFEPIIYINSDAITRYELDQRMRFMQALNAPGSSAEQAEKDLIEDRLKLQAAASAGVTVDDAAIDAGLAEFAGRANLGPEEFIAALAQMGVERQAYRDFVTAGVAWREFIRSQIVPQVNVTDAEIDQELRKVVETPVIDRVLLSEIIIPAPEGSEAQAMATAQQLVAQRPSEAEFAAAAGRLSASGTASRGGRLDWVDLDNLPPALRPIVTSLQPGQTSQPLTVPGAVVIFQLRDSQGTLRPGAAEQVLDYATLRVADAQAAANVRARVDTCGDLQAEGRGATIRQSVSQNAIPTLIGAQLASLDADESALVVSGGGVDVVMLCSRQPALLAQQGTDVPSTALPPDGVENAVPQADPLALPDRQIVREDIFNRKINALANSILAELRADAVIRRP
ncbi:peptidylprolyl isomerase [Paracoccus sp. TK19116]|uniref:Parvulin-like PPIase n=1 Tax=Paracoccus albicereus TaxID=2922394 RepID=A0ABT1MQD7_9RHOB|nr:peptidylprolyl isomerase [Paracoccus albicereus]MCQ0970527.1 peptidylprolyl isomerase [Paracoccus albicereus]